MNKCPPTDQAGGLYDFYSLYYQYCQSQSYSDYLYIFLAYVSVDVLFEKDFLDVDIIVKHSVLRWPFSSR
jgi:hypothetical protein